jgi:C-terminal processing protease CtpA/Prc
VIGSTTAGANGNTSPFSLPGGFGAKISGLGAFDAGRRPTQRVGIVPNIPARPSIAGVRERRDEVLEAAVRQILGLDVPEARIRALSKP